jgi:prepilin-type N-terminal cleavage/methylation domain-containing protein
MKGFTLLELILTVAVLGVLTATAMPLFTNSDSFALVNAAKKLENDLQYAQNLATTTSEAHGFRNIADDDIISNYEIYNVDDDEAVTSPYDHEPMQEDFAEDFTGTVFVTNNHEVEFDETGMPTFVSGDNTITISNEDGSETTTIEIVESTGMIRIQ